MPSSPSATAPLARLRAVLSGTVIGPGDADYDAARMPVAGGFDRRPAAIARVANAADVAHVVSIAREDGIELAIRSGGHSAAAHGTTDGGIVLDLRELQSLDVDPGTGTAWIGAGLTAGEITRTLASQGLAIPLGDTASVGIGGITLGGGVGYLVRRDGLTIDSLLAADIVVADGRLLRVDANSHPDLFWAIRGGGGNFGVVTRFQFRVRPLTGVVGGMLVLPATPESVAGFVAAAEAAPEELSTIANVMSAPPMPFLPESVHGRVVLLGMILYAGDAEPGARAVQPFRSIATPIVDMVRPMSLPEMYPPEDTSYHPIVANRTMFMDNVDLAAAGEIVARLQASDAAMRVAQLRVLGGAVARVPADATAYAHRGSRIMVNLAAFCDGPDDRARRSEWVSEFAAALLQHDTGAYVNFLGDEGPERVRQAYPGRTWDRLAGCKARYDPANLFRLNQNIPPMSHGA